MRISDLKQTKVSIEDGVMIDCLINPNESWNGWECPYFTKEKCFEYLDSEFKKINSFTWGSEYMTIVYNSDKDEFLECLDYGVNTLALKCYFDDSNTPYFQLGGYNWTWIERKPQEFEIEFEEVLQRVETIKAYSLEEALEIADNMYSNGDVILDFNDKVDWNIREF